MREYSVKKTEDTHEESVLKCYVYQEVSLSSEELRELALKCKEGISTDKKDDLMRLAAKWGEAELLEILWDVWRRIPDPCPMFGDSLSHVAATSGNSECFNFALSIDGEEILRVKNKAGKNPFVYALESGNEELLYMLLDLNEEEALTGWGGLKGKSLLRQIKESAPDEVIMHDMIIAMVKRFPGKWLKELEKMGEDEALAIAQSHMLSTETEKNARRLPTCKKRI